jgi:GT2 family glycosyltransferase
MGLSVSVLITNYETWPDAARCARSAVEHSGDRLDEVLIVDDCSSDTGPDDLPDPIRVLRNETNQGYVRSVNIGFSEVDSDVIVLLDSDAEPLMDFVPGVRAAFLDDPELGAMALHLVDRDGTPTGAVSPEPTVPHYVLGQKAGSWLRSITRGDGLPPPDQMCLHSCGMAVRQEAVEDVGRFDEGFDFLDADTDFSMRLRQAGWRLTKSDEVTAYHEGGGSPQSTAKRVLRHHRNRWRLLRKHKKLQFPELLKAMLALRHGIEYGILRMAGSLVTPIQQEQADKLSGRRALIERVWNGYRDIPQKSVPASDVRR